ncbi:MAG: PQQ-dependent sugar dehydrogenase [Methanospirillum sp.]
MTPDLTNQASPLACTYRNGQSYTQLATHPAVVGLEEVVGGLVAPMMLTTPSDGSGRRFIVDQIGLVRVLMPDGELLEEPFLDLRDRLVALNPRYDERGLLSLAFHPGYRENGRFFVFYSAPLRPGGPKGWNCTNHLSEFGVSRESPDRANSGSERVILAIDKPAHNHNGGPILFGPDDGYLYLALGDGGGADDHGPGHTPDSGNAQDPTNLLGKIVRIDIDRPGEDGSAYAIPPDNPFVNATGILPEIYAMGLRNPAYLSFDAKTGRLITASAGQALFESVYVVAKGGNYGWRIREGAHCFDPDDHNRPPSGPCPTTGARGEPLLGPIVEIGHDMGTTIVGGFVYRGAAMPALAGKYIFGDWSGAGGEEEGGRLLVATPPPGFDLGEYPLEAGRVTAEQNRMWRTQAVRVAGSRDGNVNAYVRGFSEDLAREVYVMVNREMGPDPSTATGEVLKLVADL